MKELSEAQVSSLEVGCPICGQQKGEKCQARSGRLILQPHSDRVEQWKEVMSHKARKRGSIVISGSE